MNFERFRSDLSIRVENTLFSEKNRQRQKSASKYISLKEFNFYSIWDVAFLPLDEAVASRVVFVIVSVSDGRNAYEAS